MAFSKYDTGFYKGQRNDSFFAATEVLPIVFTIIPCQSMLDVGCGVGPWLAAAAQLGVADFLGMDGEYVDQSLLLVPGSNFRPTNLSKPIDLNRRFDLAISMEVAEHIPAGCAETFVDNLTRHADAILFSAAIPGQGGTDHINEQWPDYWKAKFAARGYRQFDPIRNAIWDNLTIPSCYRQNAFLYVKESALHNYPALSAVQATQPVAWVHPEIFAQVINRPLGIRHIMRELPGSISRSSIALTKRILRF